MEKFTAGPWEVDSAHYIGDTDDHYHSITAGCGYHVNSDDDGFEITGCISTANARLIAAAPDLLEALEAVLSQPFSPRANDGVLRQAMDAIKKARGEA